MLDERSRFGNTGVRRVTCGSPRLPWEVRHGPGERARWAAVADVLTARQRDVVGARESRAADPTGARVAIGEPGRGDPASRTKAAGKSRARAYDSPFPCDIDREPNGKAALVPDRRPLAVGWARPRGRPVHRRRRSAVLDGGRRDDAGRPDRGRARQPRGADHALGRGWSMRRTLSARHAGADRTGAGGTHPVWRLRQGD